MSLILIITLAIISFLHQTLGTVSATNDPGNIESLLATYDVKLKELEQRYFDMETFLTKRIQHLESIVQTQNFKIMHLEHESQKTKNDLEATKSSIQAQQDIVKKLNRKQRRPATYKSDKMLEWQTKTQDRHEDELKLSSFENRTAHEKQDKHEAERSSGRIRSEHLLSAEPAGHAFYAYMSKDLPPPSPHHTFIYDYVVTNIGGNYNKHSGMFTVPESGVYFFSATSITNSNAMIYFEIVKNSASFATGLANSFSVGNYHTGTVMGIIQANTGDVIHVRSQDPPPPSDSDPSRGIVKSRTWGRTSFLGWRIL